MDNWLSDSAFRANGTNFLLPDVIDTLLEFDFYHADLKYIEREAFNIRSIPKTWYKLAMQLELLVEEAEKYGRVHSAFYLRHRYLFGLLRSWTHGQKKDQAMELWNLINDEYDKAAEYLRSTKKLRIERVVFDVDGDQCHGILRIPHHLDSGKLSILIILPGMDMTKEYVPSLLNSNMDNRGFATLTIDPPGHGYSFVCGTKLTSTNYDELIVNSKTWLLDFTKHDYKVEKVAILGIGTSSTFAFRAGAKNQDLSSVAGFEGGFLFEPSKVLSDQSTMRLKKLATMTSLPTTQIDSFLESISLENTDLNSQVPLIFSVGEFDDLFLYEQIERFISKIQSPFSLNLFEGEGHVLGKVINESLLLTLDQIEECFNNNIVSMTGLNLIKKR